MRKSTHILLAIAQVIICLGLFAKPQSHPDWYLHLRPKPDEIIGYAMDKSVEAAKSAARKDIASQIEIRISTENEFFMLEVNGIVEEKAQVLIKEQVDVSLESVYTIKDSLVGDVYYVAMGYDNSPLVVKFANRLSNYDCADDIQNPYLAQTSLIKSLNRILEGSPDLNLIRANQRWWLSYRDISYPIGTLDILQLLTSVSSDQIMLKCSVPSTIEEHRKFSMSITGSFDGYYSLVNVYENGEVFILEDNHYSKADEKWIFPDPRAEFELISGLIIPGKDTQDMYVAIYSPNLHDLSAFAQTTSTLQTSEYHFKFGELIDFLGRKDIAFATMVLHTKPNRDN